jgi:RNA polymerase sigma-70 factor (ECF subfamily)
MSPDEFILTVQQYRQAVFNYCRSRLHHYQDAEDITNAVFLKLWKQHGSIRMESILTYIKTITRNACVDFIRHRSYMVDKYSLTDYEGTHEDRVEERIYFKDIEKIIDRLPAQQKRLIRMKYIEGIEPRKISKLLGLSDSSIRNQLCTGLKNIRMILKKEVVMK